MEYSQLKLYLFSILLCVYSIGCNTQSSVTKDGKQLNNAVLTWTCPFQDSIKNVNESENWHKFLNSLYCKFSEYQIQILKRNFSVNGNAHLVQYNCEIEELIDEVRERQIDENNFESFLNETIKCNFTAFDSASNIAVSGVEIEELNHVLNLTLRDRLHVNCEETRMYVKGNYITTADIVDILLLKTEMTDNNCKNLLATDKTKFINIFALNTFFVDVNINSSIINDRKIVLMSAIAPKWENIGKNEIELNGEDAEFPRVENGFYGKPGNSGSPGGNFFGVGREFVNGINLEISVNGGNGNRGQEGKKGENGVDGDTAATSDLRCSENICEDDAKYRNFFNCEKVKCDFDCQQNNDHSSNCVNILRGCKYVVFGKSGTKGQNGGKGGKGGKGGYSGNIVLIELDSQSKISLLTNNGKNGADGKGGDGGLGGRKGSDVTMKCSRGLDTSWSVESIKPNNQRAESGQTGADGGNSFGLENPKFPVVIKNLDKAKIINQYKGYLREHLHGRFTKYFLNVFLHEIETDTHVQKVYNTLGFIDELQELEEQFRRLYNDINFLPFYQSLLNRISEYAKAPKETGDLWPYRKVLRYLYTATLSKIHYIEDNIESNLIIDIYAYLRSVKNDIDKLTDMKNAYKEELIRKYKIQYKREIDIKINETKDLISREITPEIDNIGTEIDSQIATLVNQVICIKEQPEKEHKEINTKTQELESMLILRGIFSIFKIFGDVVSFLGPAVVVAGSVIETGSTIGESFVFDNADDQTKIFGLSQNMSELQSINNMVKNIINQRITRLKNSLEGISLETIKHPDILSDMSFQILSVKDRLDKINKNKFHFKEIQNLEEELDATLQMQEETSDNKTAEQLEVIKNLKRNFELSTLLSDSYSKFKNNREKLDVINSVIPNNEEKLKKLKVYEQKIYNSLLPMLQNIQNDLQDIMSKLGTKSKVALDVTKWQIQSSLRDAVLLMHQLTRRLKIKGNFARCFEKLKEAMGALINVHEHIQNYQKDQHFERYIAEISSIAPTDIIIAKNAALEEALRHAVYNLEVTVRSNIVLQRYKVGINAFKQFVFPFAHYYFKDIVLPSRLTLGDDRSNNTLEYLVQKATVEIENIISKLDDYKNAVRNRDGCIGIGEFQSGSFSSKPFFVWKNVQHKNMISELLSGNAVTVKADVRNSAPDKDAIKFNTIDFKFKSRNETLQSEINDKLDYFRISANHLGNSNYRYENKIYEIMTSSLKLWFAYEKTENGKPVHYSMSYQKIVNGDVTLSPYASWAIKLYNMVDGVSFKDLEIYKDSVDLTLEGHGHFLNKTSSNCIDLKVDNYYKAIGTFYQVDSNIESFELEKISP